MIVESVRLYIYIYMFARSLVWFVVAGTRDRVRVSSTSQCLLNWKMLSTLCLIQLLLHDVCMFDIFQLFDIV